MNEAGLEGMNLLIMGIGNTLLQDDGAGVHVTESLESNSEQLKGARIIDGGTLGLSLLPDVESADGLIVVDAGEIGAEAGSIRVFEGEDMDRQLAGRKTTVHELALSDLLDAAAISGSRPRYRALVAIQPQSVDWGMEPTAPVQQALPKARKHVMDLAQRWTS
jgi:hydrogenase maturation protease